MKTKAQLLASLDRFTVAYIKCMLWSSTDNADDTGGEPLDANYDSEDLTRKALLEVIADCRDFQASNSIKLESAYAAPEWIAEKSQYNKPRYHASQAGHDFWLTRNGHGAGFWDRGLGKLGDELTQAAKAYGGCDPTVYRGKIHI